MKKVLALVSTAGGGDRQPVIALADALHRRGHEVAVLCDAGTVSLLEGIEVTTLVHEVAQVGFISSWIRALGETDTPPNPLLKWAKQVVPEVEDEVRRFAPDVIIGSLFCMGLAELLADRLDRPWCFVNPSFYFGTGQRTRWEDDWYGEFVPRLAREVFTPLVGRADMVLHATDPLFDSEPERLPDSHHYVGFLLWESSGHVPPALAEPGDPWALVTASTARPADEATMIEAAVGALTDRPVRPLLTFPKHAMDLEFPPSAVVTGYVPHTQVLPHSALSINQAGHGIVSKCLRFGVPMVLTPWDADQPGVAARAEALGVARIVPRAEVSPESLTAAVNELLDHPTYRERSQEVAEILQDRSPERIATHHVEDL